MTLEFLDWDGKIRGGTDARKGKLNRCELATATERGARCEKRRCQLSVHDAVTVLLA